MAAPISPDPERAEASAFLKRALREKEFTHEAFAAKLGVSPGLVSQWASNRGSVPPERAVEVGELLNVKPETVSPGWRRLRDQFVASQAGRLRASIILRAVQRMREATQSLEGEAIDVEADPDLFAEMLKLAILEPEEEASGERGIREAGRSGRGTAGAARQAEDGDSAGTQARRRRKTA